MNNLTAAMQVTRGRGQFTMAEKALPRPVARKVSHLHLKAAAMEPEEHVPSVAAPRSSGRTTLKQRSASTASLLNKKPSSTLNSALPAPTPRSAIAMPKKSPRGSTDDFAGKDNYGSASAVVPTTRVRDSFLATFAEDRVEILEELLKFRAKASKFNAKARQDEQLGYIRQLKTAVRTVCDEVRSFGILD